MANIDLSNFKVVKFGNIDAERNYINDILHALADKTLTLEEAIAVLESAQGAFDEGALRKLANLSDVSDVAESRDNLGLGTLAVIDDAPSDGTTYGRKDGAWESVGSGGGDGLIFNTFDSTPAELEAKISIPITIPFNWTITGWRVLGGEGETGNALFDVLKKTSLAGSAVSIVGTIPPEVTGANSAEGSTLTGWTTTGNAGDLIVFALSTVAAFTTVRIELQVTKS